MGNLLSCCCLGMLLLASGLVVSNAQIGGSGQGLYYFVVDRSGSIGEHNLKGPITQAVSDFVSQLPANSEVRLVFFNHKASKPEVWESMDLGGKSEFHGFFTKEFDPGGDTRLYDTVGEIINRVRAVASQYDQVHVIILSDGEDNKSQTYSGWQALEGLADKLNRVRKDSFITWYTLGFSPKHKPTHGGPIEHKNVPDPAKDFVIERPKPTASFAVVPAQTEVGEPVRFFLESIAGIDSVAWRFGDGARSSDSAPLHSYDNPGHYTVSLEVYGPSGTDALEKHNAVEVGEKVPLQARFKWTPMDVRAGRRITFIDESYGSPTQTRWVFEGIGERSERNPVVIFPTEGRAEISLTVQRGAEEAHDSQSIDVLPEPPDPGYQAQPLELSVGDTLSLQATSGVEGVEHTWTIGGDVTLHGASAVWEADRAGMVDILHQAEGPGGMSVQDGSVYVRNPPDPLIPVAEFKVSKKGGTYPLRVKFTDKSKGEIVSRLWDFGDGSTSDLRDPDHTYLEPGTYLPRLTVTNSEGEQGKSPGDVRIEVKEPWPMWVWVAIAAVAALLLWVLVVVPFTLRPAMMPQRGVALRGADSHYLRSIATKKFSPFWPPAKVTIGHGRGCDIRLRGQTALKGVAATVSRRFASDSYALRPQKKGRVEALRSSPTSDDPVARALERPHLLRDQEMFLIDGEKLTWEQKKTSSLTRGRKRK